MRVIKFVPFVLAIFLMLSVECYAENKVIFSENFIRGKAHNLKGWNDFKAKLTENFFYEGISLKGDFDKKGKSCSDPINAGNWISNSTIRDYIKGGDLRKPSALSFWNPLKKNRMSRYFIKRGYFSLFEKIILIRWKKVLQA